MVLGVSLGQEVSTSLDYSIPTLLNTEPGQYGGQAIIDVVSSKVAPAGCLFSSMYPASYAEEVPMTDMSLQPSLDKPRRVYMWYPDTVYPFGYGKHYTTFKATASLPGPSIKIPFDTADLVAARRTSGSAKYVDLCPFRDVLVTVANTCGVLSSQSSVLCFA